jgi:ABC-type uncharacterized transport system fused permease/ATPase subunit
MVMIALPAFQLQNRVSQASSIVSAGKIPTEIPVDTTVSERTQDFVTSRGLLISAADAIERMMSSWRHITELAGRTARIYEMISIFKQVQRGEYEKKQAETNAQLNSTVESAKEVEDNSWALNPKVPGLVTDSNDGVIELHNVPIITPNSDILINQPGLSLTIRPGMHLLITGPNGCGKSSLFRMLGGLWPVRGGTLKKPHKGDLFYIPQRPYLTKASLREQFIYPDTLQDMRRKGISDDFINTIVDWVSLSSVVEREGGLDSNNVWRDVLSGGEKQRVAMARLFYHKPLYAILDECTSAVSIDVEGSMYNKIKELGITLLTVTHRPTLWKYHTHILQFNGQGDYTLAELNASTRLSLQEEKVKIEQHLAGLPQTQKRLKQLCELLGENSIYTK